MIIGLYFLALICSMVTLNLWSKEDDPGDGEQLLDASAAGAGLAGLVLFVWGFFLFSWFIPISALLLSIFLGTAGGMLARRSGSVQGVCLVSAVASLGLAAAVAYLTTMA